MQQLLVEEAFGCEVLRAAPLAPAYQCRLLQALLRAAEEDGCDLADALVELFTIAQLVRADAVLLVGITTDQVTMLANASYPLFDALQDGRRDEDPSW